MASPERPTTGSTSATDARRTFESLRSSRPPESDADLAVLIREHARSCREQRVSVGLDDYMVWIDDLPTRRASLDAAIDVELRARAGGPRPGDAAVESLIRDHPELEVEIREAAVLAHALWSTSELTERPGPPPARALPAPFGPRLDDDECRYVLRDRLGVGSFGDVYLAEDRRLSDRDAAALVAIKILHPTKRDEFSRRRFIEEASKARRLDHPGIVRVFDRGESDSGEDYIVYELVSGGDLHAWLAGLARRPTLRDSVRLGALIARGVQAAHAAGLVHLDLKPANILMTSDAQPKVADFDLARRTEAAHLDDTTGLGTFAFMAPEQFRGEPGAAAPPADAYALGGLLYWLITDRLPNGDSLDAISSVHAEERAPDMGPVARAGADRDLLAILRRAMSPDASARYDSAGPLADDLESWLAREPIRWTKPSPAHLASLFARRRPGVFALLALLVVALVGAVIALDTARRFANEASARRLEAEANRREVEVAAARLDEQRRARVQRANDLVALMGNLGRTKQTGLAGEVLLSMWILEWVHGPVVLKPGDEMPAFWERRIDVLRGIVDQRRAEGGDTAFEVLTAETMLGFWLTRSGAHAESVALLEPTLERWRTVIEPGDPWLADVETMLDAARAGALFRATSDRAGTPEERAVAARLAEALHAQDERLATRPDGAQLRLMIHDALYGLYAPSLLADPRRRLEAMNTADALGLSVEKRNPLSR